MEKRMTHGVGIGMIAGATIQLGNLIDNLYNSNMCSLCELKTILKVYDDSDLRWIIIDCMSCILPMVVWRGEPLHTMEISKKDWSEFTETQLAHGKRARCIACVDKTGSKYKGERKRKRQGQ